MRHRPLLHLARASMVGALFVALCVAGCDSAPSVTEKDARTPASGATITVRSSAFDPSDAIPPKYERKGPGKDVSPPLEWTGVPAAAVEIAVICDDPDASGFVHWLAYGIAGDASSLAENAGALVEGKNGFGEIGYSGPWPPSGDGPHHYHFTVYALDRPSGAAAGLTKPELLAAMKGKIIAEGELVGTYDRK